MWSPRLFTPTFQYFYTYISAISVTFRNSAFSIWCLECHFISIPWNRDTLIDVLCVLGKKVGIDVFTFELIWKPNCNLGKAYTYLNAFFLVMLSLLWHLIQIWFLCKRENFAILHMSFSEQQWTAFQNICILQNQFCK